MPTGFWQSPPFTPLPSVTTLSSIFSSVMFKHPLIWIKVACFFLLALMTPAHGAVWQFSAETGVKKGDATGRAFLWIPPGCEHVRGLVIGQQVILEAVALEDPAIRAACAKENLALVLIVPACVGDYDDKGKGADTLQKILGDLAETSGYAEIAGAPLLTIGHSGGAIWAWNTAYWNPDRCFGVIGLHSAPIHPPAYAKKTKADGPTALNDVPVLDISGQYEAWGIPNRLAEFHWRWVRGSLLEIRAIGRNPLVSELVEPGITHFGWCAETADYVAMFIRKAAQARIPAAAPVEGRPVVLNTIAQESGWLTDPTFMTPPRYPASPYAQFGGDPTLALWHFDEEMARATENYGVKNKGKALQMVTFLQDGKPQPSAWLEEVAFAPVGDGMTAKVAADFVKETPPEMSSPTAHTLGHAPGPIQFRLIGGWHGSGEQTGPDTFRIKPDRFYFSRPWNSLMVMAWHPGDEHYAYTEQPMAFKLPDTRKAGAPQTITFASLPDLKAGAAPLPLLATADSGLPVEFCVIAGPAEIDHGALRLTAIPARAKRPVAITVAAYQWGRSTEPTVRFADPVFQTLHVE